MTSKPKTREPRKRNQTLRKLRLAFLRQFPRRKHLHGGVLHRLLGERLFDKRLWKPERKTFAVGMAVGVFIGLMPTYWVQILISILIAYFLRVNITAAVLGTLVTNPFTTLPILGLQYKVGVWLIGPPDPHELEKYHGFLRVVFSHGKPYLLGSILTASLAAFIGYLAVLVFWQAGAKVKQVQEKRRENHSG